MKSVIQNSFIIFFSISVSLIVAEFVVSIIEPQNLSGSWRVETNKGLLVNKSHGRSRHQFGDRVVHYEFASPHLRGPLQNGNVKILVLGDSYTFGWLLDNKNNYINLLQQKIDSQVGNDKVALYNAAAGGWGAADYVAFVEDFGKEINPDIVLIILNTDDIGRALRSPLWSYDEDNMNLSRNIAPTNKLKRITNAIPGYQWLLEHSHLIQLLRSILLGSSNSATFTDKTVDKANVELHLAGPRSRVYESTGGLATALGDSLFQYLHSWCETNNAHLAVITTGWHQPPYKEKEPTEMFMGNAGQLFKAMGVPFLDISEQIWPIRKNSKLKLIIPDDGHPNEAGAALIAEHIYPFLTTQIGSYCRLSGRCAGALGDL